VSPSANGARPAARSASGSRRRAQLLDRGRNLSRRARDLLGAGARADTPRDLSELDVRLAELARLLGDRLATAVVAGPEPAAVGAALAEVYGVRYEVHDFLAHERLRRLEALEAGLVGLRKVHDPDTLLHRVCQAVFESCGLERVMLSRVEGSIWRPWKSYAVREGEAERTFRQWIKAIPEIHLDHMVLETEMVRRHEPAMVTDPANDPRVYRPLLAASGHSSYVAAPLTSGARVIGFLHADYESAPVEALDRDILWAFAVAFGQMFERAVLLTRLREQREQVRVAMQTVESVLQDLASAEIDLASRGHVTALAAARPIGLSRLSRSPVARSEAQFASVLTGREMEVLALMATGATNDRIADELVIANGTVKSHVKRILRKLCVENRAEAISQYLHVTIGDGQS
jgi:DNA-binding CsgD family transcriptional regulator